MAAFRHRCNDRHENKHNSHNTLATTKHNTQGRISLVHRPGWRHGSVVRTSVSGWWTFLDLCLIYGWHMTTSWVRCPLWVNQPGQLSLLSLRGR